ncbi:MAG: hypothetical protein CME67_02275 [Halobacteriovoraceae bacterium]|nr:hypothetical protein [Halobacteriovoraceae bacterium]
MSNYVDINLFKQSSAGTNVDSSESDLRVEFKYTAVSWFFITFFGTTRLPYQINFYCKKSGELFDSVKDKERISHYMTFRRK